MPLLSLKVITERPTLSKFEKGVEGARALNFSLSGSSNCSRECAYHPKNKRSPQKGRCYAVRIETRWDRKQLLAKMKRHGKTDPAILCRRAITELQAMYNRGKTVPWFRFSTGGSVPMPRDCTKEFIKAFRDLLDFCDEKNIPVHLPVESKTKWNFYRKLAGTRCTVRWSASNPHAFVHANVPCSVVAGTMDMTRPQRIRAAKELAADHLEETGRRAVVCPAIAASFSGIPHTISKAKCGACIACSKPDVDIVYALH